MIYEHDAFALRFQASARSIYLIDGGSMPWFIYPAINLCPTFACYV